MNDDGLNLDKIMRIETIGLSDDMVELLYNNNLRNKPYMVRLTNFSNEQYEMVLSRKDIEHLADFLKDFLNNSEGD